MFPVENLYGWLSDLFTRSTLPSWGSPGFESHSSTTPTSLCLGRRKNNFIQFVYYLLGNQMAKVAKASWENNEKKNRQLNGVS